MLQPLKLSLYPRGFFGRPASMTLRPKVRPFAGRASNRPQSVELYQPGQTDLVADPEVMRLYKMWFDADPYTRSFDYRREVMGLAMAVFGTPSFLDWYLAQEMSPSFGEYHHRFLNDTLRYIQTGKRELPMRTWQRMVSYQDDKVNDYDPGGYAKQFFGVSRLQPDSVVDIRRDADGASLAFTLHQWLGQPQGLDDLLNSLYLLFGELN
jgi:hypothetical protein